MSTNISIDIYNSAQVSSVFYSLIYYLFWKYDINEEHVIDV